MRTHGSLLLLLCLAGCGAAQHAPATTTLPATDPVPATSAPSAQAEGTAQDAVQPIASGAPAASPEVFDARLSGFAYPYPVQFRTLRDQQQELQMAYMEVAPQGAAKGTVLLLHGKNFSGAYWHKTAEDLVAHGFRVVIPDQIGFGKSSKPVAYQYSFSAMATHTRELLDALEVDQVTVVGHSMGGMLATRFALMFPQRVSGLLLVNPIGLEDWSRQVPYQSVDAWYASNLGQTKAGVREYMQASYFDGTWKPEYDELAAIQMGWTTSSDREQLAWVSALTYDMIFTQPVVHEFGDVRARTLLIIGTRDRTALGKGSVSEEVRNQLGRYDRLGKEAAKRFSDAELVELPGVGHIPQVEAYDAYLQAFLDFLEQRAEGKQAAR